ncbi:hypothetical protein G3O08_03985 [Cryomorpha ignava]|uniref:Uncharacterized protein n=1 Tax=Cryomorpha ignava TaxID=101383 RepID=A0A7K3WPH7_9FLAO|nr:chromophore lyase CpcT/CpeT [Cryomorpha ignava]NEN22665.1 hypothetical protein [Cryomorpha ignava]
MKKIISLNVFLFSLFFQYNLSAQETSADFDQMVEWMTGEFNSAEQAKNDTSYKNFTLKMTQIWPDAPNGAWIYVEQALASTPAKPYSQRIYFLSEINDSQFSSDVYAIPGEEKFVGAWKSPEKFEGMTAFDLKYQNGCTAFLDYDGFQYAGVTNEGTCKSNLNGSDYSTSQIMLLPNEIRIWEKGFDTDGNQIWGSTEAPYSFKK